jgi:hypothetical protein
MNKCLDSYPFLILNGFNDCENLISQVNYYYVGVMSINYFPFSAFNVKMTQG